MRRNLVLARVGASSLHPRWVARDQPRDWDLRIVPYQEMPPQDDDLWHTGDVIPGPKWTGLREALHSWDGWRSYEHVWLPDDDILTDQATIDRMFAAGGSLGLDLFAPALDETSFFAHFDGMVNRSFGARRTGFVEIMCPAFETRTLERLLPTLDLTPTGWGWGLDSLWPKLLGYENVGVIDATSVTHTRPVGQMRDPELARRVKAESDAIFEEHDCRQIHATFAAYDAELAPLDLSPEQLLARLAAGYEYLVERDPRVLAWIAEYQRPHFAWADYPVEGTPET